MAIALVLIATSLVLSTSPGQAQNEPPTPTATATVSSTPTPTPLVVPPELIDLFRITGYEVGTIGQWSMNAYIMREHEAMILTRVSLGESQDSFEDRVAIMWLIKMRAELGFKWSGRMGYLRQGQTDRWGPPSTIAAESICVGGCQFAIMQPIEYITGPQKIAETSPMRIMLHPTDEQLPIFYETYLAALEIVDLPLAAMPEWLQGYDSFRAVWIDQGEIYRSGGLGTIQFFDQGDVWSDRWPQDNRYFDLNLFEPTPTPTPARTMARTTAPTPTLTPTPESARLRAVNPDAQPTQLEAIKMELDPGKITILTSIGVAVVWFLTVIYTGAFKQPKPPENILKGIVFVGSVTLAYFWGDAMIPALVLPPIADGLFAYGYVLLEWVTALLAVSVLIFKFAQQIFDRLWQPFMNFLGERVTALAILRP